MADTKRSVAAKPLADLLWAEILSEKSVNQLPDLHEFQLWLRYLHFVFIRSHVYASMYGLAVVLGMLLILVYNIVAFTGFFSCYLLVNYWTQWVSNEHFPRALAATEKSASDSHKKVLEVLREYWLGRPQMARIATMMFFSLVSFAFALRGEAGEGSANAYTTAAYVLTTLNIAFGEAIISVWRLKRDNRLQPAIDSEVSASA